jgi:AcrR family transcriptional regulator
MPRPARHSADSLLNAARELVLRDGIRTITVDRLVTASGAPKGSIFYRFSTMDDLLAAMWIRAVRRSQAEFLHALNTDGDPVEAAVAAGLAICDFAQRETGDARLLAAVRRDDLVSATVDATLIDELTAINQPLTAAIAVLARRLYGRATKATIGATTCAVIDIPQGAIRRHLVGGVAIPDFVGTQLRAAIPAALLAFDATSADQ